MIKYFCDRCKKELDTNNLIIREFIYILNDYSIYDNVRKKPEKFIDDLFKREFMLCYTCDQLIIEDFNNFFNDLKKD